MFERVKKILIDTLDIDEASITLESELEKDLGINSLDVYELVVSFEEEFNIEIEDEVSDVMCEMCGRQMVIKYGPHGKFLACPGFPECRNTKQYLEKIGVPCPECGKEVSDTVKKCVHCGYKLARNQKYVEIKLTHIISVVGVIGITMLILSFIR